MVSAFERSSNWASKLPAAIWSIFPRWGAGVFLHIGSDARAALRALLASSWLESWKDAIAFDVSAGFVFSKVSPLSDFVHFPSMKFKYARVIIQRTLLRRRSKLCVSAKQYGLNKFI